MQGDDANRQCGGQTWRARGLFAALSALLLLVSLLASACDVAGASSQHPATVPATPTPTLAPARPLTWQAHEWPSSVGPSGAQLALARSDGNTAYLCSLNGTAPGHAQVWVTHDRAAHWTRATDIVMGASIQWCGLVVADLQPATVIARLCATEEFAYCIGPANYLSRDGGASWAPVSGVLPFFGQLATRGDVTYAIAFTPSHSACSDCTSSLTISRDGMQTWARIDPLPNFGDEFWLRPDTGELLVEARNRTSLATSSDEGRHWTPVAVPSGVYGYMVVQAPAAGLPWHICGNSTKSLLVCSMDGGRTWVNTGGPYNTTSPKIAPLPFVLAIANDGSVLANWHDYELAGPGYYKEYYELRRLPPGATTWEPLGRPPGYLPGFVTYVAGGSGVLWLDVYEGGGLASPLYTASYP